MSDRETCRGLISSGNKWLRVEQINGKECNGMNERVVMEGNESVAMKGMRESQ